MVIKPGRPFWTFAWTFCVAMVTALGIDQIDVTLQALTVNNWLNAIAGSLFMAFAVYAKIKVDELSDPMKD